MSIAAWMQLFAQFNYHFVTVESNGVNGIFIDPNAFEDDFVKNIKPLFFAENYFQRKKFKSSWKEQFGLIKALNFEEVV